MAPKKKAPPKPHFEADDEQPEYGRSEYSDEEPATEEVTVEAPTAIKVRASGPLHEREWFGRIYTRLAVEIPIASLKPGELEKLQSDHFLTIEYV